MGPPAIIVNLSSPPSSLLFSHLILKPFLITPFPPSLPSSSSLFLPFHSPFLSRLSLQAVANRENHHTFFYSLPIEQIMEEQGDVGQRYAVVTGANRGIGLETVRQLSKLGVTVVLTARDDKKGSEAARSLHELGFHNVVFHQLDVLDQLSVDSLVNFIKDNFGRLDILVNNAGDSGVHVDEDGLRALNLDPSSWLSGKATDLVQDVMKTTYASAEQCLNTNYYGCKRVAKSLLPLLELSISGGRIVNVSSLRSELRRVPNEHIRKELGDVENLTEEKIDRIVESFLGDVKDGAVESNGWNKMLPAYSVSKVTLNAYTRVLAKKYPRMKINCVHPGYVNTELNWHTGTMTVEEGSQGPVKLALLPEDGPTGCYFDRTELSEF